MNTNKIDTNKIESLLAQIEGGGMVVVDDSPMLSSMDTSLVTGEEENEVLYMNWYDDEGEEFSVKFTEIGLSNANFKGNKIFLDDADGNPSVISLFEVVNKDVKKNW